MNLADSFVTVVGWTVLARLLLDTFARRQSSPRVDNNYIWSWLSIFGVNESLILIFAVNYKTTSVKLLGLRYRATHQIVRLFVCLTLLMNNCCTGP